MVLKVALYLVILSSLLYFFSFPEVDPDLWGHLFFGKEILGSGRLPPQNLYSYTAPEHPWMNHEWLAEVIFYALFDLFGSRGLMLLKVAVGAAIVWVLKVIIRKKMASPCGRVLALVWTMAILSPGFNIRPQLFTYLFFSILLFLFYSFERGGKTILYWTPLVLFLWVNLHGGFVAGLGALALFLFGTAVTTSGGDHTTGATMTRLFLPVALCVLSLTLNPYGLELLKFLSKDLLLDRPVTEWQPIVLTDFSFLEFKLAFLFAFLFSLRRDSLRRWDFILMILAAAFAFRHQRHTPLFAIAAAPLLAEGIEGMLDWVRKRAREWILAAAVLAVAFYQFHQVTSVHWEHRFQLIANPLEYPTQAADFIQRNALRGNLAVPFDWGEYLIWKLYPGVRVSIDGRYTTAYPTEVIQDHWNWMEGKKDWKRLIERYPTEIAITNRYHPITALLRKDPEWVYIYSDPVAFIFVRRTPAKQHLLARFREKRLQPPGPPPIYFPG